MSSRAASILSTVLSLVLLAIFAVLMVIVEMIVLNGVPESQGMNALAVSLACLGAGAILVGVLAWKTTAFLISNFDLSPVLAVTLAVALGMLAGGSIAFLAILFSIPAAGIR